MDSKNVVFSKTVWANIGLPILTILVQQAVPMLQPYLGMEGYMLLSTAMNLVLRYFTTQPISIAPKGASNNA